MKDLTKELESVWTAMSLLAKQEAMAKLIEQSHAKKETKEKALRQLKGINTAFKVDKFATNYMLSGEGMKV